MEVLLRAKHCAEHSDCQRGAMGSGASTLERVKQEAASAAEAHRVEAAELRARVRTLEAELAAEQGLNATEPDDAGEARQCAAHVCAHSASRPPAQYETDDAAEGRGERVVTLLHFSDVGDVLPHSSHTSPEGAMASVGGAARFASVLRREREAAENPLVLCSGGVTGASLWSAVTKGKHTIDILNTLGVDYGSWGAPDFAHDGVDGLRKRIRGYTSRTGRDYDGSAATWLCANVKDSKGNPLAGALPTALVDCGDVKVGLLGLCGQWAAHVVDAMSEGAVYRNIIECASDIAAQLRGDGADVVVALASAGLAEESELAAADVGVDVVLGGSDGVATWQPRARLAKSGRDFEYLSVVRLTLPARRGAAGAPAQPRLHMAGVVVTDADGKQQEADDVALQVQQWEGVVERKLQRCALAETGVLIDLSPSNLRSGGNNGCSLAADCLEQGTAADCAIVLASDVVTTGGGRHDGAPSHLPFLAGSSLRFCDVLEWFDSSALVRVVSVRGRDFVAMLEAFANGAEGALPSDTFPHASSSVSLHLQRTAVGGVRVSELVVNGSPVDPDGRYKIAVLDSACRRAQLLGLPVPAAPVPGVGGSPRLLSALLVRELKKARELLVGLPWSPDPSRLVLRETKSSDEEVALEASAAAPAAAAQQ